MFFLFFLSLIYFEREREYRRGRERGRERICRVSAEPDVRLVLKNLEIMT